MQICPVLFASLLFPLTILSLAIEPFSISFNTHNISLLKQAQPSNQTNAYRGECSFIRDRPDLPNFHKDSCIEAIPIACSKLTFFGPTHIVKDRWIWTNLPGCSLAYYVPREAEFRDIPTKEVCEVEIFSYLVERCVPWPEWNLGTINVLYAPNPEEPGDAFLRDFPRYLVSPKQLDN